jgi:RIO kinase 1
MRVPHRLESLHEMGIIHEVVRPLMSGKEAQLYLVVAGGEQRVAKVYKEADQRSFKQRTDYTDGRKVRNSRDRRAIAKGSRHGKARDEQAWQSAEVDVIYRLRAAGVRVPVPYNFMDGVLVMELVAGEDGEPAPRLGDLSFSADEARSVYDSVMQEVVRMLCAGIVHGDLSDFNILMSAAGPVVIDFPQAVDASGNSAARRLLLRDVDNLHNFLGRATRHPRLPYAQEMWELYERNELTPDTQLRGRFRDNRRAADTKDVLALIGDAERDEMRRRRAQGQGQSPGGRGGRPGRGGGGGGGGGGRGGGPSRSPQGPKVEVVVRSAHGRTQIMPVGGRPKPPAAPAAAPASSVTTAPVAGDAPVKKRRRRRRRRSPAGAGPTGNSGSPPRGGD